MKLSTSLVFGASLSLLLAISPSYAETAQATAPATTTITPAEVGTLATIATIDTDEILVSIIALNKKVNSGVADFAKMMIDQHGSNLTQILEMAGASHVKSLKGGESEKFAMEGKKAAMELGALPTEQFEKTYVDAMVKGHEGALKLINDKLMKTAKSEEMKKFMTDTRTTVEHHLEAAKKLQENMKS